MLKTETAPNGSGPFPFNRFDRRYDRRGAQCGRPPDGADGAELRAEPAELAEEEAPPPDQPREPDPLLPPFHPPDAAPDRGAAGGGIEARGRVAADVRDGAVAIGTLVRCAGPPTTRAELLAGCMVLVVAAELVATRPLTAALL